MDGGASIGSAVSEAGGLFAMLRTPRQLHSGDSRYTTTAHSNLSNPAVKHVPKAARTAISQFLTSMINKILADLSIADHWRNLMDILALPLQYASGQHGRQGTLSQSYCQYTVEVHGLLPMLVVANLSPATVYTLVVANLVN